MLLIALDWAYLLLLSYIFGYSFFCLVERLSGYRVKRIISVVFSGIVIITVYAEIFSLFYKVDLLASLLAFFMCIVFAVFFGRRAFAFLRESVKNIPLWQKITIAVLSVLWLYFSSRGWQHTDSSLYHVQTIEWIENHGVVKGIANIHYRLGYNSSIYALFAMFTLRNVFPSTPLYSLNGLFALLLSINILPFFEIFKRKKLLVSDFTRFITLYYLFTLVDEIYSPASDYPAILLVFFIVNTWLDLCKEKDNLIPMSLLCVLGVYTASVKVTVGLVVLLTVAPAIELVRKKKTKLIVAFILMGLFVITPWFIRNLFVSGYFIYPLAATGFLNLKWRVHPEILHYDATTIKEWGRGVEEYGLNYMTFPKWVPIWFSHSLTMLEKAFVVADWIAVCVFAVKTVIDIAKKKLGGRISEFMLETTVVIAFLYWQFSAPLPRYGYCHILLPFAVILSGLCISLNKDMIIKILLVTFVGYKICVTGFYLFFQSGITDPYMIVPRQLENLETIAFTIDGDCFSEYGNEYDESTQALNTVTDVSLIGTDFKEGFYNTKNK